MKNNKTINNKYIIASMLLNVFLLGMIIGHHRSMPPKKGPHHMGGKAHIVMREIFPRREMRDLKMSSEENINNIHSYLLEEYVDTKKVRDEFFRMEKKMESRKKENLERFLKRISNLPIEERERIFNRR